MFRKFTSAVAAALCVTVAGAGLAGCSDDALEDWDPLAGASRQAEPETFTGTKKIDVGGKSVNVSCTGTPAKGKPVIVLMLGAGDGLDKMAALQKTLGARNRVCSYDRLGAGASDKPDAQQDVAAVGTVLTGVLDRVAGTNPVVLAGHSLGGLIAARYAPDHRDRVKGLVLMDATPATMSADISRIIPENATGPAAQVRAQNLAIFAGQNPERLVVRDGEVRSAGDIPVAVMRHGKPYLQAVPQYGAELERAWAAGQRKWLTLSTQSKAITATGSGHYIYVDQPDLTATTIQDVAAQATGA